LMLNLLFILGVRARRHFAISANLSKDKDAKPWV